MCLWVVFENLRQNVDLEPGRFSILLHILDNFERHNPVLEHVDGSHHLAEGSLAQHLHDLVSVLDDLARAVHQVTLVVVLNRRLGPSRLSRR